MFPNSLGCSRRGFFEHAGQLKRRAEKLNSYDFGAELDFD
jgi:hypothetical protein